DGPGYAIPARGSVLKATSNKPAAKAEPGPVPGIRFAYQLTLAGTNALDLVILNLIQDPSLRRLDAETSSA
ncbi:MAG: hypothetical protein ACPL7K_07500, partial [Armatimonadota bacterium]